MTLLDVTEAFAEVREDRRFAPSRHELISSREAQRALGVSRRNIPWLVTRGALTPSKVGARVFFWRYEVENLAEARRHKVG